MPRSAKAAYDAPPAASDGSRLGPERRRLADDYETRADLYALAKQLGIEGRSKMTKAELRDAVAKAQ